VVDLRRRCRQSGVTLKEPFLQEPGLSALRSFQALKDTDAVLVECHAVRDYQLGQGEKPCLRGSARDLRSVAVTAYIRKAKTVIP